MSAVTRRRGAFALAAFGLIGFAGCDSDGGTSAPVVRPSVPAPPPPPVPEVTVSFSSERIEVAEGESATIELRYEARHLSAPWEFRIGTANGRNPEDDFELPDEVFTVPVGEEGEEVSGTASLTIRTFEDLQFAEGEEAFVLAAVPVQEGGEVRLEAAVPLELAIADAAVSPCQGVIVSALGWELVDPDEGQRPPMPATTLTIELTGDGLDTTLDLVGPYATLAPESNEVQPYSTFGISRWNLDPVEGGLLHQLEINWPGDAAFAEPRNLEFAFGGGRCVGEPVASCSSTSCELLP